MTNVSRAVVLAAILMMAVLMPHTGFNPVGALYQAIGAQLTAVTAK